MGRSLFGLVHHVPRPRPLTGPLAVVAVIAVWVAGLVVGFGATLRACPGGSRDAVFAAFAADHLVALA
jgi:hypothetical protein